MHVVILGAGYAGVVCALRLARKSPGAHITLVNAREEFVERIRLHERAAGRRPRARKLRELLGKARVELVIGAVQRIDRTHKVVQVAGRPLAYDRLVLALGSRPERSALPGTREHAYALDADSMERLAEALPALAARAARVVVVGGGLTGLELVSELAEQWPSLRLNLVSRGPVGEGLSGAARAYLRSTLERLRVVVWEGVSVREVQATQLATDRGPLRCDACVWAGGFVASELGRAAGLDVNALGQVHVDGRLRSVSDPAIHVAGDMAAPVEWTGDPLPMGCKSALPTGAHVADNLARVIAGLPELPFSYTTPFFCVSLGRGRGLIQVPRRDGSLSGPILTGRAAALFKELICKGTVWSLALERSVGLSYRAMRHRDHALRLGRPASKALPA